MKKNVNRESLFSQLILFLRRADLFYFSVLGVLFFVIFRANILVPLVNEDFDLNAFGKTTTQLFDACVHQYLGWNARIGDILSLILSTIPIDIYNTFNAVATLLFILVMVYIAKIPLNRVSKIARVNAVITAFFLLVFLVYRPGEVFLWRTGSANYFYPALFILLFSIPWVHLFFNGRDVFSEIKTRLLRNAGSLLYIVTGIVIGHANENSSPVIALFLVINLTVQFLRREKIRFWMIGSFVSLSIGVILLLFGPSTQHRIEFYSNVFGVSSSPVSLFLDNVISVTYSFLHFGVYVFVLMVFTYFLVKSKSKKIFLRFSILYFLLALFCAFILAAAPYQEPRAYFISSVFLILGVIHCLYYLQDYEKEVLFLTGIVIIFYSPFLLGEYGNMQKRHYWQLERIRVIEESLDDTGNILIPKMPMTSSQLVLVGGTEDESIRMSRYFHLSQDRRVLIEK